MQTARTPGDLKDITVVEDEEFLSRALRSPKAGHYFRIPVLFSHDANSPAASPGASAGGGVMAFLPGIPDSA